MIRWPWQKPRNPSLEEARAARMRAQADLEATRKVSHQVRREAEITRSQTSGFADIADALRAVTARNHLGDALEYNFRGGRHR